MSRTEAALIVIATVVWTLTLIAIIIVPIYKG